MARIIEPNVESVIHIMFDAIKDTFGVSGALLAARRLEEMYAGIDVNATEGATIREACLEEILNIAEDSGYITHDERFGLSIEDDQADDTSPYEPLPLTWVSVHPNEPCPDCIAAGLSSVRTPYSPEKLTDLEAITLANKPGALTTEEIEALTHWAKNDDGSSSDLLNWLRDHADEE